MFGPSEDGFDCVLVVLLSLGLLGALVALKRWRKVANESDVSSSTASTNNARSLSNATISGRNVSTMQTETPSRSNSPVDHQTSATDMQDLSTGTEMPSDRPRIPSRIPITNDSRRNPPPEFPFLKISNLISNGTPSTFKPNTREPIEFDCETCSGEMFAMLRTNPLDPEFAWVFENKKRYFELQIRIKFKMKPRGVIYLGGEIPEQMKLGFATEFACKGILAVIRRLSSACHASFGDTNGEELPHIVFPLWHAADRLVVTKPGQPLPAIGKGQISESDTSRAARFKDPTLGRLAVNKGDTVTFSFHSAYMDLVEWKLRGLGAIRDQSLTWFWRSLPLHVIVYDAEPNTRKHAHKLNRYYLRFELKNTWQERGNEEGVRFPGSNEEEVHTEDEDEDEEDEDDGNYDVPGRNPAAPTLLDRRISDSDDIDSPSSGLQNSRSPLRSLNLRAFGRFRPKKILNAVASFSGRRMITPPQSPSGNTGDGFFQSGAIGVQSGSGTPSKLYPLVRIANRGDRFVDSLRVPMWVRFRRTSRTGGDAIRYVLQFRLETTGEEKLEILDYDRLCRIIPAASWRSSFNSAVFHNSSGKKKGRFSSSIARDCEQLRRILDEECSLLGHPVALPDDRDTFVTSFLARFSSQSQEPFYASKRFVGPEIGSILYETNILRQVSETQWQEEWLVLLRAKESKAVFCLFFLNKRTPVIIIPAASIVSISPFDEATLPLTSRFSALALETLSKVKFLCFPSKEVRAKVLEIISKEIGDCMNQSLAGGNATNNETNDGRSNEYQVYGLGDIVAPSSFSFALNTNGVDLEETFRWGTKKRIILNARRSTFTMGDKDDISDPVSFSCGLLRQAFSLLSSRSAVTTQIRQPHIDFFNECSRFKKFDLISWAGNARNDQASLKAFYLNLYHIMLIHARHMMGPSSSAGNYHSVASQMSYEFGVRTRGNACVLSLAEIEHRILRPLSSNNSNSAEPVPRCTPTTTRLALSEVDPRITFALNRMCVSSDNRIYVFSKERLNEQLDRAASHYLDSFLLIDLQKRRVRVPRVLEWFYQEFGLEAASPRQAVGASTRWLSKEAVTALSNLAGESQSDPNVNESKEREKDGLVVKFEFRKFHWQPRDDAELELHECDG